MSACLGRAGTCALVVVAILTSLAIPAEDKQARPPEALKVGISRSVFFGESEAAIKTAMPLWTMLVKRQAGLQTEFNAVDTERLGGELARRELDMAVFQGYEFAWAAQQDPQLRPLVIAVNQQPYLRAAFVVRQDAKVQDLAGLRGQTLALPKGRRSHVRLYFERACRALGGEPKDFFGKLAETPNYEDALDDVVDGAAQATIIDAAFLQCYQRRKPGRFQVIRVLAESPVFPDPVIGYRAGTLDAKTLEQFRDGMLRAERDLSSRQMLTLFKITSFARIPEDYDKVLRDIAKKYPPADR
jgi:ABC-type phosphate/phosphonate transport system substrate-binding protein